MRSGKNYLILVLALTTVTTAAIAWREYRELIVLRAAALNNDERADLQKRVWAAEKRRAMEIRHHFQMSLFGCAKALNEGFFHILVLGMAIYYAINGQLSPGDVLTFSVLFLNVMTPLSEVHRVLDEGHESSLRVGDLLEMLAEPLDPSFTVSRPNEPRLISGEPALVVEGPASTPTKESQ